MHRSQAEGVAPTAPGSGDGLLTEKHKGPRSARRALGDPSRLEALVPGRPVGESRATLGHNLYDVEWSEEEQRTLEEGLQRYSTERLSSLALYVKVAALLPLKTVRDVALRVRWMSKRDATLRKPQQQRSHKAEEGVSQPGEAGAARSAPFGHEAGKSRTRVPKAARQESSRLGGGRPGGGGNGNGYSLNSRHVGGVSGGGFGGTGAASHFHGMGGGRGRGGEAHRLGPLDLGAVSDPGLMALQLGPFQGPPLRMLKPDDLGGGGVRITGSTLELLDANVGLAHTIASRLEASDVRDSTRLLCTLRDNILAILHRMTTQSGIMAQMPPLPVRPNLELADAILPPHGAMGFPSAGE